MNHSNPQTVIGNAGLSRRFAAFIYDGLLIIALLMAVSGLFMLGKHLLGIPMPEGKVAASGPIYQLLCWLAVFSFYGLFWTRSGQTLGMQAWRIRVDTLDGRLITWQQAFARFLAAHLSIGVVGLGYLWVIFSADKQSWHDKLSKSQTVLLSKREKD